MPFVYTPSKFEARFDINRCAASVSTPGTWHSHQCNRKIVNHEEGYGWCSTHTPSLEAARRTKQDAAYMAKLNASPELRLPKALIRIKNLEAAIDTYLSSPRGWSDLESLRAARNSD